MSQPEFRIDIRPLLTWAQKLIPIVAIVLSTVSFVATCEQNDRLNQVQRDTRASQFRPDLALVDTSYTKRMKFHRWADPSTIIVAWDLNLRFTFRNVGNSGARVLVMAAWDSTSVEPILREALMGSALEIQPSTNSEFMDKRIRRNEEFSREALFPNLSVQDHVATIHYIVLYENEFGDLYDTYVWAMFKGQTVSLADSASGLTLAQVETSFFKYTPEQQAAIREQLPKEKPLPY